MMESDTPESYKGLGGASRPGYERAVIREELYALKAKLEKDRDHYAVSDEGRRVLEGVIGRITRRLTQIKMAEAKEQLNRDDSET